MILSRSDNPLWEREGRDWPNHEASSFVEAGGLQWHVQKMGAGPPLLLAHGTGTSTHSWRALAPLLARHFTVVAPDLPGHGFTQTPPQHRLSLPGMAQSFKALIETLDFRPKLVAGHSAGAAVLLRMCLDKDIEPNAVISLNGALLALRGMQGHLFAPAAKALSRSSLVPRLFSWRAADPAVISRLIRDTGSKLDQEGMQLYRMLARKPGHVAAALGMMANWNLEKLERELPQLQAKLVLVTGARDRTISPTQAVRVHAMVPGSELLCCPRLGHLAHEEEPEKIAEIILRSAKS